MKFPRFNADDLIHKATKLTDNLTAHSARSYEGMAHSLNSANRSGLSLRNQVPQDSIRAMERLARKARSESTNTRIKTGVGVVGVGTAGFLGLHKYQQHKDEKIMARINQMYTPKS